MDEKGIFEQSKPKAYEVRPLKIPGDAEVGCADAQGLRRCSLVGYSFERKIAGFVSFVLRTGFEFDIAEPRAELCANIATGWGAVR